MLSIINSLKAVSDIVALSSKNHRNNIPQGLDVFARLLFSRYQNENDWWLSGWVKMRSVRDQVNREKAGPEVAPADLTLCAIPLFASLWPGWRATRVKHLPVSKTTHLNIQYRRDFDDYK